MTRLPVVPCLSALAFVLSAAAAPPPPIAPPSPTVPVPVPSQNKQAKPPATKTHPHRHRPASRALAEVSTANRAATIEPNAQGFIDAAQVYPFAENMLYRVYTAPGRVTDIALQTGEALGAVASGDTVRWMIGDTTSGTGANKRTHVLVKPFAAGLSTNLIITTDRRSYHLSLSSSGVTAMAALSWTYPQDALIALKKAEAQAVATTPVATGLEIDQLRFGYAISGDNPAWRPLRAFDDGRQTFIEFPATLAVGEAPPLFLVDRKGDAQLVNYRLRGRFYVVDRLFEAAELRLGAKHQDVVRINRITTKSDRRAS